MATETPTPTASTPEARRFSKGLSHDVLDRRGRRPHRAHCYDRIGIVALAIVFTCLLGASFASADITVKPAPYPAPEQPPQAALDRFPNRASAYFSVLAQRDTVTVRQFLSAQFRANDGAQYLRELRVVFSGEYTVTFDEPQTRFRSSGTSIGVIGIATATATVERNDGRADRRCFMTFWLWERLRTGEPENWFLHGSLDKPDLTPCTPPERT